MERGSVLQLHRRLPALWFRTSPTYDTSTLPTVTLNNSSVTVLGAALSPNAAALYQVAIQVPNSIGTGDFPVQVSIGGMTSPLGMILSVQQ